MIYLTELKNQKNIKNIQRGISVFLSSSVYCNTTISTVNLEKSKLIYNGTTNNLQSPYELSMAFLDSSTIQFNRSTISPSSLQYVSWEVIEWE